MLDPRPSGLALQNIFYDAPERKDQQGRRQKAAGGLGGGTALAWEV